MPLAQVPLFDALAHPTLSGHFRDRPEDTRFESLATELEASGFLGACAVGLDGVGGYAHEPYLAACRDHANLALRACFDELVVDLPKEKSRNVGYRHLIGFLGAEIEIP